MKIDTSEMEKIVKDAIGDHLKVLVARILEKEAEIAAIEVKKKIHAEIGNIALRVLNSYQIEKMGSKIIISVENKTL